MDKKGESGKFIVFGLIIGAAVGAAAVYVPLASYVAPAFLAFVFAAWGAAGIIPALIGATGVTLGAALYAADVTGAAYTLALYVPAALIIGFIIRNKLPWRTAVSVSALATGLALYLNLCLPSMLAGENPFSMIRLMLQENADYVMQELQAAAVSGDEQALSAVRETLRTLGDLAPQITMYFVCATAMLFSLVDVILARALTKKAGGELRPMTHFALWQLSKQYGYVSLAAIAGTLAVLIIGLENGDAVFAAAAGIVFMPTMLIGVCYMEFTLRMSAKKRLGHRIAFYLFAVLLLPYSLIFMGLMDRVTKVRRYYTPKKKTDQD